MQKKFKVAITGASGFIGFPLACKFLNEGHEVIILGRKESVNKYAERADVFIVDKISKVKESMEKIREKYGSVDIFIHNAGVKFAHHERKYYEVNCQYTKTIIEGIEDGTLPVKHFVYISSLSAQGPNPEKGVPISHYGRSKLMAEELCRQKLSNLLILRPVAVYGPGDTDFLSLFRMVKRGIVVVPTLSNPLFPLIYVKDLVELIYILSISGKTGIWTLSDGRTYSLDEIIHITSEFLGTRCMVIRVPRFVAVKIASALSLFSRLSGIYIPVSKDRIYELGCPRWECPGNDPCREYFSKMTSAYTGIPLTLKWYIEQGWL